MPSEFKKPTQPHGVKRPVAGRTLPPSPQRAVPKKPDASARLPKPPPPHAPVGGAARLNPSPASGPGRAPTTPPVFKPSPVPKCMQTKSATPTAPRGLPAARQTRAAAPAPPAGRAVVRPTTIQRMLSLSQLQDRADDRRERDKEDKRPFKDEPGGVPDVGYRCNATMCYATNRNTGARYVGYSGTSGGMARYDKAIDSDQSDRRYDRIKPYISGCESVSRDKRMEGCAEAAALSIALSHGESIGDLVFTSFLPGGSTIVNPCQNCMQWMYQAYGYYNSSGNLVRPRS